MKVKRSRLRSITSTRPGSWKGSLPAFSVLDLLGDDVAHDDGMASIGEARPGDQADPAGTEDAQRRLLHVALQIYLWNGRRPLAIASIVSFDIESRSVFTTQ